MWGSKSFRDNLPESCYHSLSEFPYILCSTFNYLSDSVQGICSSESEYDDGIHQCTIQGCSQIPWKTNLLMLLSNELTFEELTELSKPGF